MPPPATPLPMKMIGGLAGSMMACDAPSDAVTVFSSYAQLFCAAVGSGRVGCVIVPVSVTPARVGDTDPGALGTADSMIVIWYVPRESNCIFRNSPAPEPPVYVVP
jgi:hypothetical protein